jgi:hypothetical protein
LGSSVVCAEELILRQYAGFQEQPDQPRHPMITYARAYAIHKVVVRNMVETAFDIALDNPWIRQTAPPVILVAFLRQGRSSEVL